MIRHRILCLTLLLAALVTAAELWAGAKVKFSHLNMDDGLPEAGAISMIQDRLGFLWIGTQNGLVRYDGYNFRTYKPDPENPSSIGGRIVLALYEDRDGELWIGTRRGGLNRYDRATDSFVRFQNDPADPNSLSHDAVSSIVEDAKGRLWVGTGDTEAEDGGGGLNLFDRATERFTRYRHDPEDPASLGHNAIMELAADPSGGLWIGTTGGGLDRMPLSVNGSPAFTHFRHDPDDPGSLSNDVVFALTLDQEGNVWVGTEGGLNRLNREAGPGDARFTRYRQDPDGRGGLASDYISELFFEPGGSLWVGTWTGVLHKFDPVSEKFYRFEHHPDDPDSLSSNNGVTALLVDRTEILWVATWGGGLNKLDRFAARFPHYKHDPNDANSLSADRVTAMAEDRAGNVWIGTHGGGLNRFNPRTDTFNHFRHDPDDPTSLSSDGVSSVLEDSTGTLWVGTPKGLDRFNPDGGTFTHYRHDPDDPSSLSDNSVLSMLEDSSGRFWVGTLAGGLNLMDRASGRFQAWDHDPGDPDSLGHNAVSSIYEDRSGTIWTACDGGLARFDLASGTSTNYLEPLTGLDIIQSMHEDRSGRFWVGTFNGGLHLFDRTAGTSRPITEAHGLAHDSVYNILEDNQGRLWLATGNGLSRYDADTGVFRNYGVADGLQARRFNGGALLTRTGEMFFGGDNGVNAFHPEQVWDNPHPPQVALTYFKLFNQPVEAGEGAPLAQHVSVAEEIELAHDENAISFGFAAIHHSRPRGNRYAYRLEPLDKSWFETEHPHASYSNLPPGRYVFRVQAANSDGVWNEDGASISVIIRPPWWRTWWAWTGYALLLVAGLFSGDRLQRSRLLTRERARVKEQEARLQAEAAELRVKAAEAQALVLQAENDRQTRELEDARDLQLSMLPESLPEHPDFEIAAYMNTATEVGGDYYDFDVAPDGTLTIAIGDATGHGTRAGTMVTATKVLFNALASEPDSLRVLEKSTRVIKRLNLHNLFMALALAKVRGRQLEIAGAGMPPTLILRAASGRVEELELNGAPLGSFSDFPYSSASAELEPGDTVLMMSDGLPETVDPDGEVFGYERVGAALRDAGPLAPQELIEYLSSAAAGWANGRPADDDLTLVALRLRASGTPH
ncbi:MAG: SpoIIE family protein phosphatase [bacterium]|nr:SpoIIE family protein phosphatase [bacterium]